MPSNPKHHFALAALLLLPALARALPTDRDQPIKVAADAASFDQKSGKAIYTGNVVIHQGTMELRADQVVITLDKDGNVKTSSATGKPAHYQQVQDPRKGPVSADASQIDYDAVNQTMTLNGNAHLHQDSSTVEGNIITYNMDRQQADAKGRVTIDLPAPPRANSTSPGKDRTK